MKSVLLMIFVLTLTGCSLMPSTSPPPKPQREYWQEKQEKRYRQLRQEEHNRQLKEAREKEINLMQIYERSPATQ